MQPREQMSSGGKSGNGGLRAAKERKGQDTDREEQEGEQAAISSTWGLCENQKRCLPLWADATPSQVTGLGKQGAGWNLAPLTYYSCSEQSAQPREGSEGKAAKKAE